MSDSPEVANGPVAISQRPKAMRRIEEAHRFLRAGAVFWESLPLFMRPFWLAQRQKCAYCGQNMPRQVAYQIKGIRTMRRTNWDHVLPKAAGGKDWKNRVLAHAICNQRKDSRLPYPCEVFFCEVTTEIASDYMEIRRYEDGRLSARPN